MYGLFVLISSMKSKIFSVPKNNEEFFFCESTVVGERESNFFCESTVVAEATYGRIDHRSSRSWLSRRLRM